LGDSFTGTLERKKCQEMACEESMAGQGRRWRKPGLPLHGFRLMMEVCRCHSLQMSMSASLSMVDKLHAGYCLKAIDKTLVLGAFVK
jgi:hypothetical protein